MDTNILVYAHDVTAGDKHRAASALVAELWLTGRPAVSTQVLQEFYVTVTRKIPRPIDRPTARHLLAAYSAWSVQVIRPETVLAAAELEDRERLSFGDALIVTAAHLAGAGVLYSEDMQSGRRIGSLHVVNPFV
ncbi:MAG TPA: PIN domain-containing protein [Chloroflexota bacterium]|nr:PIN domain-containing protein [Chloroflexota bacterium]